MNDDLQLFRKQYEPKIGKTIDANPQVSAARYSPCGKLLFAASFDARVRRWEATAIDVVSKELEPLVGHHGWVTSVAFAPAGDTVFTADSWGEIRAWSNGSEKSESRWATATAHDGWVRDLASSPDGSTLASCGADQKLCLWKTPDGQIQCELDHPEVDLFRVLWHPDGKSLFSGDMKGKVRQLAVPSGKLIREFDAGVLFKMDRLQDVGGVRSMALDKEAKLLAVGGTKVGNGGSVTGVPTVLVFDVETGAEKKTFTCGGTQDVYVTDIAFHPAGFLMLTICGQPGNGFLAFQRWSDPEPFFKSTKMINCQSLTVHPDGQRLAVVATSVGSNGNGRQLTKDGVYKGNASPIHLLAVPTP